MIRVGLSILIVATLAAVSFRAVACPMCIHGRTINISAQELAYAGRSVLALPDSNGTSFHVVETIKGDTAPGAVITEKVLKADPLSVANSHVPLLLIRDDSWPSWVNFGPVDASHAGELRELAATTRSTEMDASEWHAHVETCLPHLDSPSPMMAAIADAEFAGAPYTALRSLKPQLDPSVLRKSLADPKLASRQTQFILLLGISGDDQSAQPFQLRIEDARRSNDSTHLAPLLAAMLELKGSSYVDWIEENYLSDPSRSTPEIAAALGALGEHGKADAAVPRERVVAAFRAFLTANPDKAGLVASLLADWQRWEFTPAFKSLIESGTTLSSAERYAVLDFITRSQKTAQK